MNFRRLMATTLEQIVGRRPLWKLGRTLYYLGRHDPENSMALNGEFALQQKLAHVAAGQPQPWIVLDVGANVGDWSAGVFDAARNAGLSNVQLLAFEPEPTARAKLARRLAEVAGPGDVTSIVPTALSDVSGRAKFMVHSAGAGSNGLAAGSEHTNSIEVDVTTLDEFFNKAQVKTIDLLKIDAEGFDLKILRGAIGLLTDSSVGVLQFEYNWRWVATRSFLADVFELISGSRYKIGKLVYNGVEIYAEWHPELERFIEGNYVLVRDDLLAAIDAKVGWFDKSNTYSTN